jgi:hypothetical protein
MLPVESVIYMNRLQEKNQLIFKLGALFGPLLSLMEKPEEYDEQERVEVIARYCAEYPEFRREFRKFTQSQPGYDFIVQYERLGGAFDEIQQKLNQGFYQLDVFIPTQLEVAQAAITSIPIPANSVILEAGTPFSTYSVLKDLCEADAINSLTWIDAYIDSSIFHRYLRGVRDTCSVTIVTSELRKGTGSSDLRRWNEFLDISRLYARERGVDRYRLVAHPAGVLHDRWACFDGKRIYTLGGSAKDAGSRQYFTLARLDASAENLDKIKKHADGGTEYFGINTPIHR